MRQQTTTGQTRQIGAIGLIVTALLMISLFAGCGGKANVRPESQLEVNKTGYPIVDEVAIFEIGIVTNQSEDAIEENDYQVFDALADLTNIQVDWKPLPQGNHVTKLILQLVAGSYPEAFMRHDFEPYDWQRLADQGFLVPLEGYVQEGWMPRFSEILAVDPKILDPIWMGDHFYSLPMQNRAFAGGTDKGFDGYYVNLNRKWMEALDLEVPNTVEEFYQVLMAFNEGDPNGNGIDDEIPFSPVWEVEGRSILGIFNAWRLIDNNWAHYMVRDGQVILPNAQPEYREAIEYLRRLYRDGLMDIEFFSQDELMFLSKIRNNEVGAWMGPPIRGLASEEADAQWNRDNVIVVPPFIADDGSRFWSKRAPRAYPGFEISNKCKSPEALLRWADTLYDESWGVQTLYGAFGQGLEVLDDGTFRPIVQPKGFDIQSITFPSGPPRYLTEDVTWSRFEKTPIGELQDEIAELFFPHVRNEPYLLTAFEPKDNRRYGSIHTDLSKLIVNKQVAWITDEANLEEEWDEYLAELEKIGASEMLGILQKNYKP